ncbi:toll/interleukin-1 receptor domain-containing adapter protein isoform X1 [Coregonus clupeaformis]|uniref:toll/interleukin-1 receptor domain-containing adapter protein isoform X1 n=1 Tax=Coregonus clupeaformis TaxID=59861 RepID=UPI001BE0C3BA|nr:toll/interleukin-1 receptor domain-containing adapter protein isoform X1 [Coregonus clupeaformis]
MFNSLVSGWFRQLLVKPKKYYPQSSSSPHVPVRAPSPSVDGASSLAPTSTPNPPPPFLSSMIRWSQTYDLCVCHSPVDIEEAIHLASYLENPACGLRCFLRQRDASVGGAITTELCQAVQSSHCWAFLITPNFLLDDWCQYMMHQALSEGPMSNRIIPLVLNLSYSQYPKELRFYYYKDLSKNPERGYTQVYKTVLKYLEDMVEKYADKVDCNMDSTSNRLEGASCFPRTKLSSNYQHSEPQFSLQETERTEAADS